MPSYKECVLLFIFQSFIFSTSTLETWSHELHMPGVRTKKDNEYLTYQFPTPLTDRTVYILEYIPTPNYSTAHHMIIYGCTDAFMDPKSSSLIYSNCGQLLYAWAHGATKLTLPSGVGVPVGPSANIRGLLLELHYLPVVTDPDYSGIKLIVTETHQPRIAGVMLMSVSEGAISPRSTSEVLDMSCRIPEDMSFTLMGMRTHAHTLGRKVVAYRVSPHTKQQQLLGRGDPRWPQRFYPLQDLQVSSNSIDLNGGDILLGRCFFDSTNRSTVTHVGSTHKDEMCNVYLLYHTSPSKMLFIEADFCMRNEFSRLTSKVMEQESPNDKRPVPNSNNPTSALLGYFNEKPHPMFSLPTEIHVRDLHLGQLSAVATLQSGNQHDLLIMHRGPNHWVAQSFDSRHFYLGHPEQTVVNPLVLLDPSLQTVKQQWGSAHFLMPHGLFVSHTAGKPDALFVTDVALHQLFKFDWGSWDKPVFTLGTRLRPGSSTSRFCQPADVTVSSTGEIFVADGYCNNRIIKFSPNGTYITHWSTTFNLSSAQNVKPTDPEQQQLVNVHSITIIPSSDGDRGSLEQVCAANRELGQVVCFTLSGQWIARYSGNSLPPALYALEYSKKHGLLFGLNVAFNELNGEVESLGVLINPRRPRNLNELHREPDGILDQTSAVVGFFAAPNLQVSHDMALSPDGNTLYVVETDRIGIHRFTITHQEMPAEQPSDFSRALHRVLSTAHVDNLSGAQWAGLIMLFILLLFLATLVCIRMCWCGRRQSNANITPANPHNSYWASRPKNAKRVGFRLLNQDDELSDGFDDDEGDQEDIILERSFHTDPLALRVDAENKPVTSNPTLRQLASRTTDRHSLLKSNGSTKEPIA